MGLFGGIFGGFESAFINVGPAYVSALSYAGGEPQAEFLRCLQKLGRISHAQLHEHIEWNRRAADERDRRSDQKTLERLAAKYKFKAPRIIKGKR